MTTALAEKILRSGGVMLCACCNGDLVRIDGKLQCGFCGWTVENAKPVSLHMGAGNSYMQGLADRLAAAERENEKKTKQIAELETRMQRPLEQGRRKGG